MAKPSEIITWATDATFTADGDAWGGSANKVDPGATRRAEGAEPDTFPAEWYNYHHNAVGQHIEYIHDVLEGNDTPTPGLGVTRTVVINPFQMQASADNGGPVEKNIAKRFNFTLGSTGTFDFELSDLVPRGAEISRVFINYNKTNTTSTTFNLYSVDHGFIGPGGETLGSSLATVSSTTSGDTNDQLSPTNFAPDYSDTLMVRYSGQNGDKIYGMQVEYIQPAAMEDVGFYVDSTTGPVAWLDLRGAVSVNLNRYIPDGAVLQTVRVLTTTANSRISTLRTKAFLRKSTGMSFTGGLNAGTDTSIASGEDDGTASLQVISLAPGSHTMDSAEPAYVVVEGGSANGLTKDLVHGIEVTFTDPGPRNF